MSETESNQEGFIEMSFEEVSAVEMLERANEYFDLMSNRRTTRHFSKKNVSRDLIELAIKTAGTAPSGAHLQPWTFVAISDFELKSRIRKAAEEEERKFYEERVPDDWAEVLRPLGTDHVKEHLTDAPWVVVLFRHSKRIKKDGEFAPTYYSQESCGIAAGMFISAIHNMGLTTLTHTPSPMGFLRELLNRPESEHPMIVMPVGYPAKDAKVPDIMRKKLEEISYFHSH